MRASKQTIKRRKLIAQGEKIWAELVIEKWGANCNYCDKPAVQVHHFHRKSQFGYLRFDIQNGVPACQGCHLVMAETPVGIEMLRQQRGEGWYKYIMDRAFNRPENFKATIPFIKSEIARLTNELAQGKIK